MKRDLDSSSQSDASHKDVKFTVKYKSLLEEYLELQKEYVSFKRKLRVAKQKREILECEIRFLKHRHAYLTKLWSKPEFGPSQNADIHHVSFENERNSNASKTKIQQESNEREEPVENTSSSGKPMNLSINEKKSGKKKVSWKDEESVKV